MLVHRHVGARHTDAEAQERAGTLANIVWNCVHGQSMSDRERERDLIPSGIGQTEQHLTG